MMAKMADRVMELVGRPKQIRNIGIAAHIDHGKTTLSDNLLAGAGMISEELAGKQLALDFHEDEQTRGITIDSASVSMAHKVGDEDFLINLIDTPGHVDFTAEVERSLRVLDGAVCVFCAVGGVEPQSETVWIQANKYNLPRLVFINKMDRLGADFENVVNMIHKKLGARAIPVQIPYGKEENFKGVIDLIELQAFIWNNEDLGETYIKKEIPEKRVRRNKQSKHALFRSCIMDYAVWRKGLNPLKLFCLTSIGRMVNHDI